MLYNKKELKYHGTCKAADIIVAKPTVPSTDVWENATFGRLSEEYINLVDEVEDIDSSILRRRF